MNVKNNKTQASHKVMVKCGKINPPLLKLRRTKKGFTLIEVMVSIFIFALMMTAISGIFARQISSYKQTRIMANDLENAQFALNYVAKTLRTASIIGVGDASGGTKIEDTAQFDETNDFSYSTLSNNEGLIVYDFSQEACVIFTFKGSHPNYAHPALWMESQSSIGIDDIEECLKPETWSTNMDTYKEQRLTTGDVTGNFVAAPTRYMDHMNSRSTDTMGRATIAMSVVPAEYADNDHVEPVHIQSSVSLRDYPSDLSF